MFDIKKCLKTLGCLVLVLSNIQNVYSQLEQFFVNINKYNQTNGLSSPNIRKIDKDKFGFTWIATQDGLNKFDGKNFVIFNSNDIQRKTIGSDFHDFAFIENYIYALTSYGGVNVISPQTNTVVKQFDISTKLPSGDFLEKIISYGKKSILLTKYGQVFNFNLTTGEAISINPILFNNEKRTINSNLVIGNYLWIGFEKMGIVIYDLTTRKIKAYIQTIANTPHTLLNTNFSNLYYDYSKREVVAATDFGMLFINTQTYFQNIEQSSPKFYLELGNSFPKRLCKYNDQWLISTNKELLLCDSGCKSYKVISPVNKAENGLWLQGVQSIFSDEGIIFTGNQSGLTLINNLKSSIIAYSRSSNNYNTKIGHATSLCSVNDSIVYSCDFDKVLYKTNLHNGEIKVIDSTQFYFQAIKLTDSKILFSGRQNFKILENNNFFDATNIYPSLKIVKNDFIIATVRLNDSILLMAGQNTGNAYVFNMKSKITSIINGDKSKPLYIDDLAINNFFLNSKKELLVVSEKSISVLDLGRNRTQVYHLSDNNTKAGFSILMDATEIGDNYYFAAYGDGVVVTDKTFRVKELLSSNQGILNNGIYKIYKLTDTSFICSSNNGVYIYDINKKRAKKLGKNEGLQADYFEETSGEKTNGQIILGGEDGFTVFYPERFKSNIIKPKIYFGSISLLMEGNKVKDSTNITMLKYLIPNNTIQTLVSFIGINYSNPERTIYQYRILEQSKGWIDLGNQNFVTFISHPPGTYHLQVKAANEDGVWSEPKELVLIFLPKWYQTWWFYLLIALAVAAILYALYRYRISQIKKQHEIRKNIATDLHDDLGSTLNSVKVFTNLAISGIKQEESLQLVKDNLTEATMGLRDMIWVLDDSLDTVDELVTRLKQFAIPVTDASNMEFLITADSDVNSRQLTKEEKRNLFLICKEAINNSIKYSGATQINVDITASGKKIQIVVADNGTGFNVDEVKKGYGLKNMQYRAEQVRFKVTLTSALNKGTQITLQPA